MEVNRTEPSFPFSKASLHAAIKSLGNLEFIYFSNRQHSYRLCKQDLKAWQIS
jgi:hypothetical protein